MPMSRLLAFTPGSSELNVKCYMHTSEYRPQGWYEEREACLYRCRSLGKCASINALNSEGSAQIGRI